MTRRIGLLLGLALVLTLALWRDSRAQLCQGCSGGGGGASSTIYPALTPSAGQMAVGNAGSTAYAPVTASGLFTMASTGVATASTTAQPQFSSLGLNAAAPATAGLADFLNSDNSNTWHTCFNSLATNVPSLGFNTSCPVTTANYALGATVNSTLLNAVSGGSIALRINNSTVATITGSLATGTIPGTMFGHTTVSATPSASAGACTDTAVAVASATTSMTCTASPQGAPAGAGAGNMTWACYTTAGNANVRLCTLTALTAAATTYNVTVWN